MLCCKTCGIGTVRLATSFVTGAVSHKEKELILVFQRHKILEKKKNEMC